MSDPDTFSTSDPEATEGRTAKLFRKYQGRLVLPVPIPFGSLGVGLVPVNLFSLISANSTGDEQAGLTASSPTVDESTLQHDVAMLAEIDRIIARLDHEVPRAIDAMDHLLAEIHDPKKRSAA